MDAKLIAVDSYKTCGSKFICTGVKPYYKYENNAKTDVIEGYSYEVVLPERSYEKINVKVEGTRMLPELDGNNLEVKFDGLEMSISLFKGVLYVSAKASCIKIAENK